MLLSFTALLMAAQGSIILSQSPTAVQLLRETTDGLSVRYSIDQLDYQEIDTPQGKFTDFNIQHYASTNQSGMPRLPLQRQIIAVPEGATVAPRIVNARRQTISLASRGIHYPIMPRQQSVSKSADLSKISFEVNRDFYNRSIWTDYPSVSVEEIGYMRGVRLFALDFAPVRYNPALGEIEVILEAEVRVDFPGADLAATEALRARTYSPAFNGIYQKSLLNPIDTRATLNRYPMGYLIITPANFVTALQPFVDWKIKEGFNVTVATTDQTGSTANAIKSYLQNIWTNATTENPAPSYLMIVGDVADFLKINSGPVLVLSERTTHCKVLQAMLADRDVAAEILIGNLSARKRREVVALIRDGKVEALCATGSLVGEGFDLPAASALFLAVPIKFSGRVTQYVGRVLRPSPGKERAVIYDYVDSKEPVLAASGKARQRAYQKITA